MNAKDVKDMLVPKGLPNHPNRNMGKIKAITIHETGNYNPTATAEAHARFQYNGGGGRQASWHYTVDESEIWRSFNDRQMCWHTGTRHGNESSIGIEICVNSRSGFLAACGRSAELTAHLMAVHGLGINDIVQHNYWNAKNCPAEIRSGAWGITWEDYLNMVRNCEVTEALRNANISFDEAHWRGVFDGSSAANQEWVQILISRIIDQRWALVGPEELKSAIMALLGRKS